LEVNTSQIITSTTAAPYLKIVNLSNTERDPIIQFAVGATPVVKWTYGLDDSDDNKWKLAVGDKFGEDYDTIVVSSGEGSAPPIAEFTLIDSFTTGTYLNPRGVCADANYIYYSFQDQLIKIDKTTGAELAISAAVPPNTYMMYSCVTDGTYVYVACRGTSRVRKYFCSDLTYDSTSEFWNASLTGLAYSSGYLYITNYNTDNVRKIRCSDMVTQWTTAFTVGAGDNQLDDPYGIAADNQYVYVQDLDNDRIVRLNASDGSWVDATAVAQTFSPNSWAMWCAGDYLYNTALYAANDCKVEKRNKADLSISETFDMATNYAQQGWQRDDYHYVVDGIAEYVYKYQYVSFGGAGNSHIKFRLESAYGQFNDIAILTDEIRFGVGTTIPSETIEAVGNIKAQAGQFISTKATGTAPVVVSSTTVCTNLNAGLVDGYHHDQSLLIAASPTFVALNLSATSNQIVLQSAGVTGTITATPASSNKVWTLQNVTGTIYQTGGTDVSVADGGTGASTFALNGILYGNAASAIGVTAIGAEGQVLRVGANPYVPAWSTLTLPNTGTAYRLPVFSAANVMTELAAVGATGEYLAGATGAIPAWATLNQAAVAGLTTGDGPPFDHIHLGVNGINVSAPITVSQTWGRGDFTAANAFLWASASLAAYAGTDTGNTPYSITVTDAAGKTASGYIGAVGAGETLSGIELVTNGNMELDSNWLSDNTPVTNERSNEQAHAGTYSRKLVTNGFNQGIYNPGQSIVAGALYLESAWIYTTQPYSRFLFYDGLSPVLGENINVTASTWTQGKKYVGSTNTGATGFIEFANYTLSGTWYIDDASLQQVLDPPSTGVHIVSAYGGSTRAWTNIDGGFNPNTITTVAVTPLDINVNARVNTTESYKVDGIQVVKEQQVHIADPAETTAANTTAIKAILAMCEAHGLVASA